MFERCFEEIKDYNKIKREWASKQALESLANGDGDGYMFYSGVRSECDSLTALLYLLENNKYDFEEEHKLNERFLETIRKEEHV